MLRRLYKLTRTLNGPDIHNASVLMNEHLAVKVACRASVAWHQLDRLADPPIVSHSKLRAEIRAIAQLMRDEVTDWRIVHSGPRFIPA